MQYGRINDAFPAFCNDVRKEGIAVEGYVVYESYECVFALSIELLIDAGATNYIEFSTTKLF